MSQVPTPQQLQAIRAGYQPLVAGDSAAASLGAAWPPGAAWINAQVALFYETTAGPLPVMSGLQREWIVIPLLASSNAIPFDIAVHVYWGIAEGMSIDDVYAAFALGALYGGMFVYSDGLKIAAIVLEIMATQPADKLDTISMFVAINAAFPAGQMPA